MAAERLGIFVLLGRLGAHAAVAGTRLRPVL